MAVTHVEINDFLAFRGGFAADFVLPDADEKRAGINVLIGENATGKTTLLKCLYRAMSTTIGRRASMDFDSPGLAGSIDDFYISIIYGGMPTEEFNKTKATAKYCPVIVLLSDSGGMLSYGEHRAKDSSPASTASDADGNITEALNEIRSNPFALETKKSVMIPDTEMLSHSKGLLALCHERFMPFDRTELDILAKAQLPETRIVRPNAAKVLDKIRAVIGGETVYENDMFYIRKENDEKVPFSLEASGYKKFGLLWKLLRNGLLENGTVLLWDEPENSLNPELVPMLAEVLLELSRNGVQIFLATHSEILASYFDVLRAGGDSVMFYSLYKDSGRIRYDSNERFEYLRPNALSEEAVRLYKEQLKRGAKNGG